MKTKYGIEYKTSGVYMITNKVNGKRYIGSSIDISSRISSHMNREARKQNTEFYKEAYKYGRDGFEYTVLEECSQEYLLERETYYFELLEPEYNMKHPKTRKFINEEDWYTEGNMKAIQRRKVEYNQPDKVELFRHIHTEKMKPCHMFTKENEYASTFISLAEAARWLDENTNFKTKNKVSKVKAVCDKERPTAFGYKFKYADKSVTTIPKGSRGTIDTYSEAVNQMKQSVLW